MSMLTAEIKETLPLAMAPAAAADRCENALKSLGWKVETSEPTRFVAQDSGHVIGRPRAWVIDLADDGNGGTTVSLHGSLLGGGPLIKAQLGKSRDKLRAAIAEQGGGAAA